MSGKPPSRTIFIGNIPYGLSEEQIGEIFASAGRVVNFRLVYDHDTGKPKGFGFLEYEDLDTAASAVRNLNDYEVQGRNLRVDYSNEGAAGGGNNRQPAQRQTNLTSGGGTGISSVSRIPGLPDGVNLPLGFTCADSISRTLNQTPPQILLDCLKEMKELSMNNPEEATNLLRQVPQLAYALLQAMLQMNLIDPIVVTNLLETINQPQQQAPAQLPSLPVPIPQPTPQHVPQPIQQPFPQQPQFQMAQQQQQQQQLPLPVTQMPNFPQLSFANQPAPTPPQFSQFPPPLPPQQQAQQMSFPNPYQQPAPAPVPLPIPQPQQSGLSAGNLGPLKQQILMMSEATINALPPDQAAQLRAIKTQILSGQL